MTPVNMTLEELKYYNGTNNKKNLIALKNIILDVSGSEFYSPEGSYGIFAGKDISVALAKSSFESIYFNAYNNVRNIIKLVWIKSLRKGNFRLVVW